MFHNSLLLATSLPASFVLLYGLFFAARYLTFMKTFSSGHAQYPEADWSLYVVCQQLKISRHQIAPSQHFKSPDSRFNLIHVDLVGPRDEGHGFSNLKTTVDRFTRWVKAITLRNITATSCAIAYLASRYGAPSIIRLLQTGDHNFCLERNV